MGLQEKAASAQQPVASVEVRGLVSMGQKDLLDLMDIHKDRPIDRKLLQRGIKRAFSLGLFSSIEVESRDKEETALEVSVQERGIIASVSVSGNDHFSDGFIKKLIPLETGKRLRQTDLTKTGEILRKAMRLRGVPEADISVETIPLKGNRVKVELTVSEGRPERIEKILISGPDDFLRSELDLSEGDIFDSSAMEGLSRKTSEHYKKQGYIKTSLQYSFKNGLLDIHLEKGIRLDIAFDQNKAISSKDLLKECPFFDVNDFSDDLVEEATSRIIATYHREGYPFAQVAPTISRDGDLLKIEFFIFEGERFKTESIAMTGLSGPLTIPRQSLIDIIVSREGGLYNPDQIGPDTETLTDFYHALGYLSAVVKPSEVEINREKKEAKLSFSIEEGDQVRIAGIEVRGNRLFTAEFLLGEIALKTGGPYNDVDISDARRKIISLYNGKGCLDVQVSVRRDIAGAEAKIRIDQVAQVGKVCRQDQDVLLKAHP
ncbi:MAG: hypothetical protein HGA78_06760, partial [Nitrospirales bacterium]|nr:hypothetical protein [Nitrospirales bacterium]